MPPTPAIERTRKKCKCGCGMTPDGRKVYAEDHEEKFQACRKRLGAIRRYAKKRDTHFGLDIQDIKDLLWDLPDLGEDQAIERIVPDKGYVRGNLILRPRRNKGSKTKEPKKPDGMSAEDVVDLLIARLEKQRKAINKNIQEDDPKLSLDELLILYHDQDGLCAVSGEPLAVATATYPSSIAISRRLPEKPWTTDNTILVIYALKPVIDKWGAEWVVRTGQSIAKHNKGKKS